MGGPGRPDMKHKEVVLVWGSDSGTTNCPYEPALASSIILADAKFLLSRPKPAC